MLLGKALGDTGVSTRDTKQCHEDPSPCQTSSTAYKSDAMIIWSCRIDDLPRVCDANIDLRMPKLAFVIRAMGW